MHYFGYFILVSLILIKNTYQEVTPVEPKCFDADPKKIRCCTDYRTIGGKCYLCIGSFGYECSKPCPGGYYGVKCAEKCPCERCNAKTGACFNGTKEIHNVRDEPEKGTMTWIPILLGLLGSMGSLAVLFLALYVKERKNLVQSNTELEDPKREGTTNDENEEDDYDSIRESRLVFDNERACGGQKRFKTLDNRVSYAKTQTIQNPYNKLSFNRFKNRTMDFKNGELYNISETASLVGDYITVASDKTDPDPLKSTDSIGEDNDEPYSNYYSDVANRQTDKEHYCQECEQNPDIPEKKARHMPKAQKKKPPIKPKPAHLGLPNKNANKEPKK